MSNSLENNIIADDDSSVQEGDHVDPLVSTLPAVDEGSSDQQQQQQQQLYQTKDELIKIVSERQVLHLTEEEDEMMDPIERAVRFIVPIPNQYYWDVISKDNDVNDIPSSIKLWHKTIYGLNAFGTWTNQKIGQPMINFLGLNESRFQFVLDQMDTNELERSARSIEERKRKDQEKEKSNNKKESNNEINNENEGV